MAGFIRRFLEDPGLEVLLEIEGVVIIDREPPANITGLGSGTVLVVGEFEDGEFEVPCEVFSGGDLRAQFGGFGYEYDGIIANNPCARTRLADSALIPEYWNGNGFISLVNKRFRRLIICRVDTSVGQVEFTRLASVVGNDNTLWDLEPGQTLAVEVDGAAAVAATFDAAVATEVSGAGTYPSTFVGGEQMTVTMDAGTSLEITKQIFFQVGDQTQAQVINRINGELGYTAAVDAGGGVTNLSGRIRGTSGKVDITSIDALVTTATGFSVGVANGTGDVADIDNVTFAEAKTVIEADVAGTFVDRDASGNIRLSSTTVSGTTRSIEVITTGTTALNFEFPLDELGDAFSGEDGTIPAGTRVQNAGGTVWVTMKTLTVSATEPDDYTVKVRPGLDDGSIGGAGVGTVDEMTAPISTGSFAVTNAAPITAALTEASLDAQYVIAIDKTRNPNNVSKEANIIFSARQSNAIRQRIRSNVIQASADGLRGRMGTIRPPLKTTRATARGSAAPGVGATRDQRVVYTYPGANTFVPQIASRGLAGGNGFTVDGRIDTGFDSWVASTMSQLPPEENPGQLTGYMTAIVAIEVGNTDVQDMTIDDYKAFKRAGIAALRIDEGTAIIQSGKTSVNPVTYPNLQNINRRRMADFIQDSIAFRLRSYNKKLATRQRRSFVIGEVNGFMNSLVSPGNESEQRIDGYNLDPRSGNTPETLAAGVFRLILKVRTLPSLDVIVIETVVGESVEVNEVPLAA